jgi:hypothetical protein
MRSGQAGKTKGIRVLFIFALVTLISCAGRETKPDATAGSNTAGKTDAQVLKEEPPLSKRYRAIAVDEFEATAETAKDYPEAARECQVSAVQAMKDKKAYQAVESGKAAMVRRDGTLWVKAKVIEMRIVSGAARMWGGAFAGSSHMDVQVTLIDAATNTTVREKKLSSANNPWAAAWVGGTSDVSLPADVGRMIAEYIYSVVPK